MDNLKLITDKFGYDWKQGAKDNIHYCCPFCEKRRGKKDTDYKLYVSIPKLKFFCFKCRAKGRIGITLGSNNGVYNSIIKLINGDDTTNDEQDNIFYVPSTRIEDGTLAYDYLINRGFTREIINYYNIRLGTDKLFGRIIVPNILFGNNWTDMYSARSYINQDPKYLNPEGCFKTDSVFNLHRQSKGGIMYVVEGAITSIRAGKDSVCIYGSSPSDKQLSMILSKKPQEIYCCLDNDPSGLKGNQELADKLSSLCDYGATIYIVYMPEGLDAADLGEEKFKDYVHKNKLEHYSSVYTKIFSIMKEK